MWVSPTAGDFMENLVRARKRANEALKKVKEKMKQTFDRKHTPPMEWKVGDQVWIDQRCFSGQKDPSKLDDKWVGPFLVEEKVRARAYRLTVPATWKGHPVFHEEKLKTYHKPWSCNQEKPHPDEQVIMSDPGQEYEVKSILVQQDKEGQWWYLVHWTGYSYEDNTWEPLLVLSGVKQKVHKFKSQDKIPRRGTMLCQIKPDTATCLVCLENS
jgi:hypothetical protein